MPEPLENLSAEEAVKVMRERIGQDGTVALVSLLRHSQETVIQEIDARFERFEERMERRFGAVEARIEQVRAELGARIDAMDARVDGTNARIDDLNRQLNARIDGINARIDGTLRTAIAFSLSLLGLVAAVATGLLAWRG